MTRPLLLISLFVTLFCSGLVAQPASRIPAYKSGESLSYAVSYKVGFIMTDVAGVTLAVNKDRRKGEQTYRITGTGTTYPFYKWFFDMKDVYDTWIDTLVFRPIEAKAEIREAKYRFSSRVLFNWDEYLAHSAYRNHKRTNNTEKTLPLTTDSYDALSLFYGLRNRDLSAFTDGNPMQSHIVLEDTVRVLNYRFIKRETKQIKGLGTFRTLKFACTLVTSTGEGFDDGSEMFLWISDDLNKIPLYLESPIKVGSVQARLLEAKNLKFPLSSKIK